MAKRKFKHTHSLTELALHFSLGTSTVNKWRYQAGFPARAVIADGPRNLFDVQAIEMWLRQRPVPRRARPTRWRAKLGLPMWHSKLSGRERQLNAVRLKAAVG